MEKTEAGTTKQEKTRRIPLLLPIVIIIIGVVAVAAALIGSGESETMPWEKGGKQPAEYSWEEFQALEGIQKDHFYESFGSPEAFEAWMAAAGGPVQQKETLPEIVIPWEEAGAKQPGEYSWEEYQTLSPEQQEAFVESFASIDAFEAWMNGVNPQEETEPTTEVTLPEKDAASPEKYTWEEYQALTPEQKDAFFESFESPEAFQAWMERVKPAALYPWENGGKAIDRYTWEEFLALSPELQEAFFLSFHSPEDFEFWMNRVNPQ